MPTVFQSGSAELKRLQEDRTVPRLDAYFRARVREWPHPLISMECGTVGVFFDLGSALRGGDAFELLGTAAMLPWDELSDQLILLGVDLLLELASASGTTEIPPRLNAQWDSIARRVKTLDSNYLAWALLARHYRKQA